MKLEARITALVQKFLRIDNEMLMVALESLLHKTKTKFFEENLKLMSVAVFKK